MYITLPESSSALQTNSNVLTGILFLLFVSGSPPLPRPPPTRPTLRPPLSAAGAVRTSLLLPTPRPVPPPFGGRPAGSGDRRPGRRPSAGARWHAATLPCHRPAPRAPSPCWGCCRDPLAALAAPTARHGGAYAPRSEAGTTGCCRGCCERSRSLVCRYCCRALVLLCFVRRVKLGLASGAGDKPNVDRWIDGSARRGAQPPPLCHLTKVTLPAPEGPGDRLCSQRPVQPFAFLLRLSSRRPYCGGLYKNSQPSTRLRWTTHHSSDDTAF